MLLDIIREIFAKKPKKVTSTKHPSRIEQKRAVEVRPEITPTQIAPILEHTPPRKTQIELRIELERQLSEYRTQLNHARTFEECFDLYENVNSEINNEDFCNEILKKALEFASSPNQYEEIFQVASGAVSTSAAEKLESIFLERIANATSSTECIDIRDEAYNSFELELDSDTVYKKAMSLMQSEDDLNVILEGFELNDDEKRPLFAQYLKIVSTIEKCEEIWNEEGVDTEIGRDAILRASELIQIERVPKLLDE